MCLELLGACVIAAGITNMDIGYNNNLPTTASSYNGVERDISQFYNDEQTNFFINGDIYLDSSTRISLGYNHGIDTAKYDVSKAYTVGISQAVDISSNQYVIVGGSYTYGGRTKHTPCLDNYDREYYCGNLALYDEVNFKEHKTPYSMSIKYVYKF